MVDYGSVLKHPFEKTESPQFYDQFVSVYIHDKPYAHTLGLIGGNDVSIIKGNQVDLESDLRGITRQNTRSLDIDRVHSPLKQNDISIKRKTPKESLKIDTRLAHLPVYQMWAYPATYAPSPIEKTTCASPEKY